MDRQISVFDFSGIYERESFYLSDKSSNFCKLDLKSVSGTNCFCDDAARETIRSMIAEKDVVPDGVHFIDSGNYHYMSAILTEQVKDQFSLVVLDHHPDMQAPMFGDILSCGGWVLDVIANNPFVQDIHVIGADKGLISKLEEKDRNRAFFYDLEEVFVGDEILLPKTQNPVYLSIDKDVLDRKELVTNWDQGEMSSDQLMSFVGEMLSERLVIGIDVCGECAPDQEGIDVEAEADRNSRFNEALLEVLSLN